MRFRVPLHNMTWSTYYGGEGDEKATDVVVDDANNIFVVGVTTTNQYNQTTCAASNSESGLPTCDAGGFYEQPAGHGQFIARFNESLQLNWGTLYGPDYNVLTGLADQIVRVTVDELDRPYVFGTTKGNAGDPLPLTPHPGDYDRPSHADGSASANTDMYVGMFAAGTPALLWSTYYGGMGNDVAGGIHASSERVYIGGETHAVMNFPLHAPSIPGHSPYLNETPQATATMGDGTMAQLRHSYTVGMAENASSNSFYLHLFPNPANNEIHLVTPSKAFDTKAVVTIWNALGQKVMEQNALNGAEVITMNVATLAPGTYTVTLVVAGERSIARFVKQ